VMNNQNDKEISNPSLEENKMQPKSEQADVSSVAKPEVQ